jgi:hypothetical protein
MSVVTGLVLVCSVGELLNWVESPPGSAGALCVERRGGDHRDHKGDGKPRQGISHDCSLARLEAPAGGSRL